MAVEIGRSVYVLLYPVENVGLVPEGVYTTEDAAVDAGWGLCELNPAISFEEDLYIKRLPLRDKPAKHYPEVNL
jgi:hypothetical protein